MTEGGFYQQKRMSPQAVGIVILLHGAALTALLMAKGDIIQRIKDPPIDVRFIADQKPPPEKPKPLPPQKPQVSQSQIDTPRTIVPTPPIGSVLPQIPVNPTPTPLPGPIASATLDLPPVPPPPRRTFEPARAHANLGTYVHNSDYPDSALRNDEQGTTRFRLSVGTDGRVTDCTVTGSSGSSALDAATCRLTKSRARFTPARDASGNPATDNVASAIHWVLPAD